MISVFNSGILFTTPSVSVTVSGIINSSKGVFENALRAKNVNPSGYSIEVIFVPANASSPMVVTPSGIVTFVKLVQSLNVFAPIIFKVGRKFDF